MRRIDWNRLILILVYGNVLMFTAGATAYMDLGLIGGIVTGIILMGGALILSGKDE